MTISDTDSAAVQARYPQLTAASTISIQGQPGSFHHIGARMLFGDATYLYRDSFREVFDDGKTGKATHLFLAIENSIAGSIIYNYDLLAAGKNSHRGRGIPAYRPAFYCQARGDP